MLLQSMAEEQVLPPSLVGTTHARGEPAGAATIEGTSTEETLILLQASGAVADGFDLQAKTTP